MPEEEKVTRMHFRIPVDGLAKLKVLCEDTNINLSALLRKMVLDWHEEPKILIENDDKPKTRIIIQLPETVANEIHAMCDERGITRSALLRNIVMTDLVEIEKGERSI